MACDSVFTQMRVNKCFKKYGPLAVAAMIKEFKQLNKGLVLGKPVVVPADEITLMGIEERELYQL